MTYITKRQDGAPEWTNPAIKCRVRDRDGQEWKVRWIIYWNKVDETDSLNYVDSQSGHWRYAEPVEAWQPQEGEIVAKWARGAPEFVIGIYSKHSNYNGFARLVYPDGLVIDCACDVETLKSRVGEGNWI